MSHLHSAAHSLLTIALVWGALLALGLAQDRHYEEVFAKAEPPARQRLQLQASGWALLVLSLSVATGPVWLGQSGIGISLVLWVVALTVAAISLALLWTYVPQQLLPRALPAVAAVAALALSLLLF